jgi:hypothetical protein
VDAVRYTPRLGGRGLADHSRDVGVETPNVVERDAVELAWSRPRGDDGGVLRGAVSALLRLWLVSCRTCGRTLSWYPVPLPRLRGWAPRFSARRSDRSLMRPAYPSLRGRVYEALRDENRGHRRGRRRRRADALFGG